jgi:uncharacterized membrane protein
VGPLSNLAKFFLVTHVVMAVVMVGAGYVQPIVLAKMKERGPNRVPLLRVSKAIAQGFTLPFVAIQPLTGAGLILTTHNLWNPFRSANGWLFTAIVLFVILAILDFFVAAPKIRRLHELAEAGDYDTEAFEKDFAGPEQGGSGARDPLPCNHGADDLEAGRAKRPPLAGALL